MATSGSYNFSLTCAQIIQGALRKLGVLAQGDQGSPEMMSEAREALELLVKELQNEHVFLWTRDWEQKTFTASSEVTGTDGLIYTCILSHTSSASNRPITGADWTTYWRQDGSTGGGWVTSTAYASIGDFTLAAETLDIEKAFIRDGGNDFPVKVITWDNYADILDKDTTGRPVQLVLDRQLTGRAYLYPHSDSTAYVLHYLRIRKLEDFDALGNDPDAPSGVLSALIWKLAAELIAEYPAVTESKARYIEAKAETKWQKFRRNDQETSDDCMLKGAF